MKRFTALFFAALIGLFSTSAAFAQAEDRHKVEGFVGYSYHSTDTGLDEIDPDLEPRLGSHGFNASVTGNLSRYVGIKGDFSWNRKQDNYSDPLFTGNVSYRTAQFLGGVQFKDNSKTASTVKPFGHVLAGVANQRLAATATSGLTTTSDSFSMNNFSMAFGGGVDVKVHERVDVRLFQFDYNPIFTKDRQTAFGPADFSTQHNFRIGVGIVFH